MQRAMRKSIQFSRLYSKYEAKSLASYLRLASRLETGGNSQFRRCPKVTQ